MKEKTTTTETTNNLGTQVIFQKEKTESVQILILINILASDLQLFVLQVVGAYINHNRGKHLGELKKKLHNLKKS